MRPGRPVVTTEEVLAKIAELRALGHGYGTIAQMVGVSKSTVCRVLRNGTIVERFQNHDDTEGRPGGLV